MRTRTLLDKIILIIVVLGHEILNVYIDDLHELYARNIVGARPHMFCHLMLLNDCLCKPTTNAHFSISLYTAGKIGDVV